MTDKIDTNSLLLGAAIGAGLVYFFRPNNVRPSEKAFPRFDQGGQIGQNLPPGLGMQVDLNPKLMRAQIEQRDLPPDLGTQLPPTLAQTPRIPGIQGIKKEKLFQNMPRFQAIEDDLLSQLLAYEVDAQVFAPPGQRAPSLRGEVRGRNLYQQRVGSPVRSPAAIRITSFAYDPVGDSNDPGIILGVNHNPLQDYGLMSHYLRMDDDQAVSLLHQFIDNRIRWAQSAS